MGEEYHTFGDRRCKILNPQPVTSTRNSRAIAFIDSSAPPVPRPRRAFCRVHKKEPRSDILLSGLPRESRKILLAIPPNPSDECDDPEGVVNIP
jgi:hypothetical protein